MILALVLALSSVSSTPPPAPPPPPELAALRVFVLDVVVDGLSDDEGAVLTRALVAELARRGFSATHREEVAALAGHEAEKQQLGTCTDAACLNEIAEAYGAGQLVTARGARIGSQFRIDLARLTPRTGGVLGRSVVEGVDAAALLLALRQAVVGLGPPVEAAPAPAPLAELDTTTVTTTTTADPGVSTLGYVVAGTGAAVLGLGTIGLLAGAVVLTTPTDPDQGALGFILFGGGAAGVLMGGIGVAMGLQLHDEP